MRIGIDIDGVLRDSVAEMVRIYNTVFGADMRPEDVRKYAVKDSFPLVAEKTGDDPHNFFFGKYGELVNRLSAPFGGVAEAVAEARAKGHTIHIISYQPSYENRLHTLMWLETNGILYDTVTFCTRKAKNLPELDVMVDDNPEYFRDMNVKRCVLIDRPYNEDLGQYHGVLARNHIRVKNGVVMIERFGSVVDFLSTLQSCECGDLF